MRQAERPPAARSLLWTSFGCGVHHGANGIEAVGVGLHFEEDVSVHGGADPHRDDFVSLMYDCSRHRDTSSMVSSLRPEICPPSADGMKLARCARSDSHSVRALRAVKSPPYGVGLRSNGRGAAPVLFCVAHFSNGHPLWFRVRSWGSGPTSRCERGRSCRCRLHHDARQLRQAERPPPAVRSLLWGSFECGAHHAANGGEGFRVVFIVSRGRGGQRSHSRPSGACFGLLSNAGHLTPRRRPKVFMGTFISKSSEGTGEGFHFGEVCGEERGLSFQKGLRR